MGVISGRRNRQWAEIERRRDACRGKQTRPHGIVCRLGPARAVEIDCIDPGSHEIAEHRPTQHAERDEETKHPKFGIRTEHNELAFQTDPDKCEWLHNCEASSPAQHAKTSQPIRSNLPRTHRSTQLELFGIDLGKTPVVDSVAFNGLPSRLCQHKLRSNLIPLFIS
jgi:hypothetical protein